MTSISSAIKLGVLLAANSLPVLAQTSLPQADDSYFLAAQGALAAREAIAPNTGRAKNVILFIVDGMSIPTITAARILEGQLAGKDGESNSLAFEMLLPHTALVKTYSHDGQVPDSAPTATAITSGIKTLDGTIGVDQTAVQGDCATEKAATTMSIFEQAEEAGLATGIISTARITHATPAAAYAHTVGRDWETDSKLPDDALGLCPDIAAQFVDWPFGDGFEVAFGGGRANFMLETQIDPEDPTKTGARKKRDLLEEWQAKNEDGIYVWDQSGFEALSPEVDKALGLFSRSAMNYESNRHLDQAGEPSIAEMTVKAVEILSKEDKGFVLMVEGGLVDAAHHYGNASNALRDTIAVSEAVQAAFDAVDPEETLIVFTADHSHVMTFAGYPPRNNPILAFAGIADDGKPYTTLGYMNGPGAAIYDDNNPPIRPHDADEEAPLTTRADLSKVDTGHIGYQQQSLVPLGGETHGGEDVAVFAQGPQAYLFDGVIEQNMIYHVMAKALGFDGAAQ